MQVIDQVHGNNVDQWTGEHVNVEVMLHRLRNNTKINHLQKSCVIAIDISVHRVG